MEHLPRVIALGGELNDWMVRAYKTVRSARAVLGEFPISDERTDFENKKAIPIF
jgi:hypothetical protein